MQGSRSVNDTSTIRFVFMCRVTFLHEMELLVRIWMIIPRPEDFTTTTTYTAGQPVVIYKSTGALAVQGIVIR